MYGYLSKTPKYMTGKSFKVSLKTFHCLNNAECPSDDRLHKVQRLVDSSVENLKFGTCLQKICTLLNRLFLL